MKPGASPMVLVKPYAGDLSYAPANEVELVREMQAVVPVAGISSNRSFIEIGEDGRELTDDDYDVTGRLRVPMACRVVFSTYAAGIAVPLEHVADGRVSEDKIKRQLCMMMLNTIRSRALTNEFPQGFGLFWRFLPAMTWDLNHVLGSNTYLIRSRWQLGPLTLRGSLNAAAARAA